MATIEPSEILIGETPRLFDEWQEAPTLWDAIRYEVDRRNAVGQFILTGSTNKIPKKAKDDPRHHTGTGRFTYLMMRPMSLYESGESNGKVSLKTLFDAPEKISATSDLNLRRLAFATCRGGWPSATTLDDEYGLEQAKDYYDSIINDDISKVDSKKRDMRIMKKLLRSYARNQAQSVSMAFIANDIGEVSHYRDGNGLECDAVVSLPDGRYGLIQVKLGQTDEVVQDGASKLLSLRDKLDFDRMHEPSFMMVLTGNGLYAYRREDGVYVVPIGCLRP